MRTFSAKDHTYSLYLSFLFKDYKSYKKDTVAFGLDFIISTSDSKLVYSLRPAVFDNKNQGPVEVKGFVFI